MDPLPKKLQQGNYDAVIDKTVKKLIRKPDAKDAAEMDRAYRMANERDYDRIKYLKMENNPDNYDEIFSRYNMLKERQTEGPDCNSIELWMENLTAMNMWIMMLKW